MQPTKAQKKISDYNKLVGKLLNKYRNKRDLTIEELAKRSEVSVEQIVNIESGDAVPSYVTMSLLARGLSTHKNKVKVNQIYPDIEL